MSTLQLLKPGSGRFIFKNLEGHEPCHDFSPTGCGKRLARLNYKFQDILNRLATVSATGAAASAATGAMGGGSASLHIPRIIGGTALTRLQAKLQRDAADEEAAELVNDIKALMGKMQPLIKAYDKLAAAAAVASSANSVP